MSHGSCTTWYNNVLHPPTLLQSTQKGVVFASLLLCSSRDLGVQEMTVVYNIINEPLQIASLMTLGHDAFFCFWCAGNDSGVQHHQ